VAVGHRDRGSEARTLRLYVDASGLVKLIVQEPESPEMESLWNDAEDVVCMSLGYLEGRVAIARRLPRRARGSARRLLDERWQDIETVEPDDRLLALAVGVADAYRLRPLDALHLAAAVQTGGNLTFATWDGELAEAARAAGFETAPP
jgi:predicted nucleic acid-binding protein